MFLLRPQRSNRCLNMLDLHGSYTYIQVLYFQTTAGTQSLQQTSCDTLPRCGMSCYQKPRCTFTEALMYMQQLDIVVVLQGSPCKLHIINSARTVLCSKTMSGCCQLFHVGTMSSFGGLARMFIDVVVKYETLCPRHNSPLVISI